MNRIIVVAFGFVFAGSALAADWPQWRGPDRNGHSQDTGLLQEWPKDGPTLRWKASDIGTGYSSPIVVQGRVFLQSTRGEDEVCLALDEKTGDSVWSVNIGKVGKNKGPQYPGTRATPTADGDRLYCLASDGELACLDAATGTTKWHKNLVTEFEGEVGFWAYSESLLIDGEKVICTPGGKSAGLAALNKLTGAVIWKCALPDGDTADYASVMTVEGGGVRQYVQFLRRGVVGVEARTGRFLWRYNRTVDMGANILTPVVLNNRVFTSGSRTGGGLVELQADGDTVKATEVYFDKAIAPSIGGAVLVDGYLYGSTGNTVFCTEFATGQVKWKERSVGPSSICYADRRLYVRGYNDKAEIALVEATSEGYRERGRFAPPDRSKIQPWPHPVVANGGLYLRDQGVLLCYDVAAVKGR
jgi:outer membrane protein assembly factor BamB